MRQLALQHQRQFATGQRPQQPEQPHHLGHIGLRLTIEQAADAYGLAIRILEGDPGVGLGLPRIGKRHRGEQLQQTIAEPGFPSCQVMASGESVIGSVRVSGSREEG